MGINLELEPADTVLPCPFCGGIPELCNTHTASYWLECRGCGAEVHGIPVYGKGKEVLLLLHRQAVLSALKAWNRRTP